MKNSILFSLVLISFSQWAQSACYSGTLRTKKNTEQLLTILLSDKEDISSQVHVKAERSNRIDISCEQGLKSELCFLMNGGSFVLTGSKASKIMAIKGVFKSNRDETDLSIVRDGQERKIVLSSVADSVCEQNLPLRGWDHVSVAPGEKKAAVGVK